MSRETYPLSTETSKVLSNHVKAIAIEMDVDPSYLYQILSSVVGDPFANFRRLYAATARAGGDVTIWDAAFAEIRSRYRPIRECTRECLVTKVRCDADSTVAVVNALDGCDHTKAHVAIQRQREALDDVEASMTKDDLRGFAKEATNGRARGQYAK